jgi:hypothetical protein
VCGVIGIVILLIGPLFLFSSFSTRGDTNPISKAAVNFKINIANVDGEETSYMLFKTQTVSKRNDTITDAEYSRMGFEGNAYTKAYTPDQFQYVIMSH